MYVFLFHPTYLKSKSLTDRKQLEYTKQFCKELLRNTKKQYFNNLDTKKITDKFSNKKKVTSNKNSKSNKFILNGDGKTVSNEKESCRTFSTYFVNIISDLQITKIQEDASDIRSNDDPVLAAINTFQNHFNVVNIKRRQFNSIFSFKNTNENEVRKIVKNLSFRKSCQGSDIAIKIITLNIDLFGSFIC